MTELIVSQLKLALEEPRTTMRRHRQPQSTEINHASHIHHPSHPKITPNLIVSIVNIAIGKRLQNTCINSRKDCFVVVLVASLIFLGYGSLGLGLRLGPDCS
jgi:hypothetical protein